MDQLVADRDWNRRFCDVLEGEVPLKLLGRYLQHAHFILKINYNINVTAITDPAEMARKLYFPSWRLTEFFALGGSTVADLGSGGGFPGVPIAMAVPSASLALIESVHKKAQVIEAAVQEFGLKNARTVGRRGEDYLRSHRVDFVVAQAVKSTRELLGLLAPVRKNIGKIVLMKGPSWEKESSPGEEEALGFQRDGVISYVLPKGDEPRVFLSFLPKG